MRNVISSAVGSAAKLAVVLAPELELWFTHKLTTLPTTMTPNYEELAVESTDTIMRSFAPLHASDERRKDSASSLPPTLSRVQWTQV